MSNIIKFLLDGQEMLEYDRNKELPDAQRAYLDDMDTKMAQGIKLVDEFIQQPDQQQKSQFVAFNVVHSLKSGEDQMAVIFFTYLVNRLPDLKQVKAMIKNNQIGVEFIFDEVKPLGQKIEFKPYKSVH